MELKLGETCMVFDPWLIGPAFARGWWLLHEPPSDWLERVCRADLIYISHMHSDHLRYVYLDMEKTFQKLRFIICNFVICKIIHLKRTTFITILSLPHIAVKHQ